MLLLARRDALRAMLGASASIFLPSLCAPLVACAQREYGPPFTRPPQDALDDPEGQGYADSVDALADVLVPAERDESGTVVSPGAREVFADRVLDIERFVVLAMAQGILPPLTEAAQANLSGLGGALRAALNANLDVLAARERPLTAFKDLSRAQREALVAASMDDPTHGPGLQVVRAACFTAYLGGVYSDAGLRAVGFPPFENLGDGLAISGYPRTRTGRLVDATREDLKKLAAAGDLDDYTPNREPAPTPGDPLARILDANGDLP